jgi:hypothetical protein
MALKRGLTSRDLLAAVCLLASALLCEAARARKRKKAYGVQFGPFMASLH